VGVRLQDSAKSENQRIINRPPPKMFHYFSCFSFLYRNIVIGAASFFPSTSRTSCCMAQRSVCLVEKFWTSYPLKGHGDVFLFLGRPREFMKPRSTNAQKARDERAWTKRHLSSRPGSNHQNCTHISPVTFPVFLLPLQNFRITLVIVSTEQLNRGLFTGDTTKTKVYLQITD
jgi:hypothetical protein